MYWARSGTSILQQLLDGQAVGLFVGHHRHVVEPVHVGQRLDVGLAFGQFLGGTVQQADMRVGALHHLAVELQHQAQHAVRGRMLRPEIQGVVLDLSHGYVSRAAGAAGAAQCLPSVVVFPHDARRDLARLDRDAW
jgi:hypothetical protein